MKEPRGKKVAVPNGISENGVLAAGLDVEVGKQAVQYQVCGPAPPPTRCRALPSGRGCRAGAFGLDLLGSLGAAHALPCLLSVQCPRPQVLNEVVIDRGPSSYLSNVDVYLDGHLITTVQGDGRWASGLPGGGVWGQCPSLTCSLSRRRDRLHPDGQHGVCGRRGRVHDPPQRARHHGHTHLPPLAVLSAHCGARGG